MATKKNKISPVKNTGADFLFKEIKSQIEQVLLQVVVTVNQLLTHLYWYIGGLIHHHILEGNRAAYGKEIIATLSQQLTAEYGEGYTKSSLSRMWNFHQCFRDANILATLSPN